MKTTLILITLCMMATLSSFAQSETPVELQDGVYEFFETQNDSNSVLEKSKLRRLLIKKDSSGMVALYRINNNFGPTWSSRGIEGFYFLPLGKNGKKNYRIRTNDIRLKIIPLSNDTIEIEVTDGNIDFYYSGGIYEHRIMPFLEPQKYILVYKGNLTETDEEELKSASLSKFYFPYRLQNELWSSISKEDDPLLSFGMFDNFYFFSTGQFRYIHSVSAGVYFSNCYWGTYSYDDSKNEVNLTVEGGHRRGNFNQKITDEYCPKTLFIKEKTDSTIIVSFTLEGDKKRPIPQQEQTLTLFRQQSNTVLAFPGWNQICEVKEMEIYKGNISSKPAKINPSDQKIILDILKSAKYDEELNDGRMMKSTTPDFSLKMIGEGDWNRIFVEVWPNRLKVGVYSTDACWYSLDDFDSQLLFELWNEYMPEK